MDDVLEQIKKADRASRSIVEQKLTAIGLTEGANLKMLADDLVKIIRNEFWLPLIHYGEQGAFRKQQQEQSETYEAPSIRGESRSAGWVDRQTQMFLHRGAAIFCKDFRLSLEGASEIVAMDKISIGTLLTMLAVEQTFNEREARALEDA